MRDIATTLLGPEHGEPDEARYFDTLVHHILQMGKPLVLIIEDLHWADQKSLDWLQFMGRRLSQIPVLLVATYRDDELGASHPLLNTIAVIPAGRTERLAIRPLTMGAVRELCRESPERAKNLHKVTGGNPFFVTELLAADGHSSKVPGSVSDVISARLGGLPAQTQRFLEFAACSPRELPLATINELELGDIEAHCELACARNILVPTSTSYRFRHELVRIATYARMTPTRRQKAHASFLQKLLNRTGHRPPLDLIVHHAEGAQEVEKILSYAPAAARQAAQFGAHREAANHLRTALRFIEQASAEQAAMIYEQWAYEAGLSLAIDDEVIQAREQAIALWRQLGRADKIGENLSWLSRMHWYRGEAERAQRYVEEAIRTLEHSAPSANPARARAFALRAQYFMLQDNMADAITWGQQAYENAVQADDQEMIAHALNTIGTAKLFRGNADGETQLRESLDLALTHGFHEQAARVYTNLSECLIENGCIDKAEQLLEEGIAFDSNHDLDSWTYYLVGRKAQLRFEQDRYDEAILIAESVLARENQTLLMKMPAMIVLARAKLRRGDDDAQTLLAAAADAALRINEPQYTIAVELATMESCVLQNRTEEVTAAIKRVRQLDPALISPRKAGELLLWSWFADTELGADYNEALPSAFAHFCAGRFDQAAADFAQRGMRYLGAWSRLASKTTDETSAARALLESIGAAGALQSQLLYGPASMPAARKPGRYKAASAHPYNLTKQEQKVLAMLADGLSNTAIADQLSRSRRTIENHVSSVLSKLHCKNRLEAALRVQSEPWILPGTGDSANTANS